VDPKDSSSRPRALVVDGDPVALRLLQEGLEAAGVDVIVAGDGSSALRLLVDHILDLDLLVTDLNIPAIDGVTLVRIIRAEGGERELPILVAASAPSAGDLKLLSQLCVNGIVHRSVGSERIVRRAAKLATEARARRHPISVDLPDQTVPVAAIQLRRVKV
jgi:CheY-like chemotaxis protein